MVLHVDGAQLGVRGLGRRDAPSDPQDAALGTSHTRSSTIPVRLQAGRTHGPSPLQDVETEVFSEGEGLGCVGSLPFFWGLQRGVHAI